MVIWLIGYKVEYWSSKVCEIIEKIIESLVFKSFFMVA